MTAPAVDPQTYTRALWRGFELKQVDPDARTFSGRAAAYSQDLGGDIILPGAFKRTLKDWRSSKKVLPLLDSHNGGTVRAVVGKLLEAEEVAPAGSDPGGLDAEFEVIDGPDGDEVFRRVKGGYVDGLSIGYRATELKFPTPEEEQQGIYRFLKAVELKEISVVLWPMNPDARIDVTTVKALQEEVAALKAQMRGLVPAIPGTRPPDEGTAPPGSPAAGLALEDPRRLRLEAAARELAIRSLGITGRL